MSIYSDMPAYEAAEVSIEGLTPTDSKLLERAAQRDFSCDFCASVPGETCRFSTWKAGVGSPVTPHMARMVAAFVGGWNSTNELTTHGPLKEKVQVVEPIEVEASDFDRVPTKELEVVTVRAGTNDEAVLVQVPSKNYAAPCQKCGKPIAKTGLRGRPPRVHAVCPV